MALRFPTQSIVNSDGMPTAQSSATTLGWNYSYTCSALFKWPSLLEVRPEPLATNAAWF